MQRSPRDRSRLRVTFSAIAVCALGMAVVSPIAAQDAGSAASDWLFIDADTVWGPDNIPEDEVQALACVQGSRFAKNEEVVWRVKVFDPMTGQPMDDTTLASVQVKLPTETLDLHFGPHPRNEPVDNFWTTGWLIPEDYPTGVVDYTIEATALDGRIGTWNQFGVTLAQLQVTDEVRPTIEEEEE